MSSKTKNERHLYRLIDPRNGETFYFGQTSDPSARLKQHCKAGNPNTKNQQRINEIIASGQYPVMDVIFSMHREISIAEFSKLEKMAIKKFVDAGLFLENSVFNR